MSGFIRAILRLHKQYSIAGKKFKPNFKPNNTLEFVRLTGTDLKLYVRLLLGSQYGGNFLLCHRHLEQIPNNNA